MEKTNSLTVKCLNTDMSHRYVEPIALKQAKQVRQNSLELTQFVQCLCLTKGAFSFVVEIEVYEGSWTDDGR